jgi:hypothetical protein
VGLLRYVGRGAHAVLLLAVLIGSAAYTVAAGWRDLVGLAPVCQGDGGFVTCISGDQPSGLAWYGTAFAVVFWFALLRWARTSLAMRAAARTVITLGTGMYAAELFRGEQARALTCYYSQPGHCIGSFQALTPAQAALGLLVGVAVAFAVIPTPVTGFLEGRTLGPVVVTDRPVDRA